MPDVGMDGVSIVAIQGQGVGQRKLGGLQTEAFVRVTDGEPGAEIQGILWVVVLCVKSAKKRLLIPC